MEKSTTIALSVVGSIVMFLNLSSKYGGTDNDGALYITLFIACAVGGVITFFILNRRNKKDLEKEIT